MKATIISRNASSKKHALEKVVPLKTPYSVHIDICSFCNFKCKFCFQSDEVAIKKKGLKRGLMTGELFTKIVDDLAGFKNKISKVKIGLLGEPTLHPALNGMIAYLKYKKVAKTIEMFTNGSRLKRALSERIITAGLDRINISVEGLDSQQYEEMTGAKIDMGCFLDNLKYLYKIRGKCKIYIKTITQQTDRFYNMFGDLCDEIYVENIVPQWTDANKFMLGAKGMYHQKIKDWKHVCPFLFMYLHYNYDGTVSGCTLDWPKEVLIGDANKQTALEIWQGKHLKELQVAHLEKRRKEIPFCDKCLAPMVCCNEDLDDYAEKLLEKIR